MASVVAQNHLAEEEKVAYAQPVFEEDEPFVTVKQVFDTVKRIKKRQNSGINLWEPSDDEDFAMEAHPWSADVAFKPSPVYQHIKFWDQNIEEDQAMEQADNDDNSSEISEGFGPIR